MRKYHVHLWVGQQRIPDFIGYNQNSDIVIHYECHEPSTNLTLTFVFVCNNPIHIPKYTNNPTKIKKSLSTTWNSEHGFFPIKIEIQNLCRRYEGGGERSREGSNKTERILKNKKKTL